VPSRVLRLNPDTEVWPGVLDAMSDFLAAHPRAAVAGCRLVRRDGSFDHATAPMSHPSVAAASASARAPRDAMPSLP
jgi:hypothetical protein